MPSRQADVVLMLHSHLPYVMRHGRWPHGSDWLCEVVVGSYLPLLEALRSLEAGNVAAPVTLGVTPVLASQLADGDVAAEVDAYLAHRLAACRAASASLRDGDGGITAAERDALLPVIAFWDSRLRRLQRLWHALHGDLPGEFRRLQDAERLELASSAATHAYLPLLACDESIRLQLAVGRQEHRRQFGRDAEGCWLPECAYRPRGMWSPAADAPNRGVRLGLDEHLAHAGFRWFFTDAHLAQAGEPLGAYAAPGDLPRALRAAVRPRGHSPRPARSPYRAYRVSRPRAVGELAVMVRDPVSTRRVWSRGEGYPGDGAYLEFHRQRWPDGLRLWRVTSTATELGDKAPYDPAVARLTARAHAHDFASLLDGIAAAPAAPGAPALIAMPFDTELFGHWWFEGPSFLADLYAELPHHPALRAVTATEHLDSHASRAGIRLGRGSWGRDGDDSMWFNDQVGWMWPGLWTLESAFWRLAPRALQHDAAHPLLDGAARALLLLQASDWPFIVTTGAAADYATARFRGHADECAVLLDALAHALGDAPGALAREMRSRLGSAAAHAPGRTPWEPPAAPAHGDAAFALARSLRARDALFPGLVPVIAHVLASSPDAGVASGGLAGTSKAFND